MPLWKSQISQKFCLPNKILPVGPSGRAVYCVGLRPLACWDCGIESHRGRGCLLWVLCMVRYKSLRRADHSSREVIPTVTRRCVWSRNLVNEEAMVHWVLSVQKQTKILVFISCTSIINSMYLLPLSLLVTFQGWGQYNLFRVTSLIRQLSCTPRNMSCPVTYAMY